MRSAFLILLLSCALACFFSAVSSTDTPVLDIDRKPLVSGYPYFVLPVVNGFPNASLGSLPPGTDGPCPRDVWFRPRPQADPVLFFPEDTTHGRTIVLQELLFVMFDEVLPCPSTQWMMNDTTGYVTTGGVMPSGSDSNYNYYGYFRIDTYDPLGPDYYRLYSCPTPLQDRPCSTIGNTPVGGVTRYTFPLIVKFEKVPDYKLKKMPRSLLMPRQYSA